MLPFHPAREKRTRVQASCAYPRRLCSPGSRRIALTSSSDHGERTASVDPRLQKGLADTWISSRGNHLRMSGIILRIAFGQRRQKQRDSAKTTKFSTSRVPQVRLNAGSIWTPEQVGQDHRRRSSAPALHIGGTCPATRRWRECFQLPERHRMT